MKRGVNFLAVLTAVMMISGMAWAFNIDQAAAPNTRTNHVKVSPGNKGDLLIFPFYFAANGGWETKLTVVNTSTVYSVVAKVIFRSHLYSEELLDFLIYLTPADVWTGMVRNNGAMTYIYSTDDSILASADTFASATTLVSQQIYEPRCTTTPHNLTDSADYGYLEVIESWYGDVSTAGYTAGYLKTGESATRPVTKAYLKRIYEGFIGGNAAAFPGLGEAVAPGNDHTINVMSGFLQFQNPLNPGMTSGMQAVAFADWDNISPLVTTNVSGLLVNPVRNSIGELEAALAKNNLAYPYVNNPELGDLTVHLFNFPTKLSTRDTVSTDSNRCRYIDGQGNFWNDPAVPPAAYTSTHRVITYGSQYFDTKENALSGGPYSGGSASSTMPEELNILHTGGYSALFTEGWTNYNFTILNNAGAYTGFCDEINGGRTCAAPTHSYTGIPVIGSVLEFVNSGLKLFEPAYTDGVVYTGTPTTFTVWWPDFQYFNQLTELGRASF